MPPQKIAVIGAGNMARALIGGLRTAGFDPRLITVADPTPAQLSQVRAQFGVEITADNALAAANAQLIILAVKPQDMHPVVTNLRSVVVRGAPLVLSVAAGVRIDAIVRWLGGFGRVVRAMPNRPALLGRGVTALFAPPLIGAAERTLLEQMLSAVGAVVWLDHEEQMDAVTAVSGSGPAYFFLLIELLEAAARERGLPAEVARRLSVETAYGAAYMAKEGHDPAQLRAQVTSRGGTTEAALAVLENANLRGIVNGAVAAACRRSAELADQYS
jgi:pyrroline-5-carboxylate reductase